MHKKKKVIVIIVAAVLLAVLLIPEVRRYKDGGTVEYHAVLYQIFDWHSMCPSGASNVEIYYDGLEVRILGKTIFNNAGEYETRYCD